MTEAVLGRIRILAQQFDATLARCALYGNADAVRDTWRLLKDAIATLPAAAPPDAGWQPLIGKIADAIQERGRKHASGEPLFFDRLNLELAIRSALEPVPSAPPSSGATQ